MVSLLVAHWVPADVVVLLQERLKIIGIWDHWSSLGVLPMVMPAIELIDALLSYLPADR